jgi:hypothetical protein
VCAALNVKKIAAAVRRKAETCQQVLSGLGDHARSLLRLIAQTPLHLVGIIDSRGTQQKP